jgi:thioredoxin 1
MFLSLASDSLKIGADIFLPVKLLATVLLLLILNWKKMSGKYLVATDLNFKTEIIDSDKVALVDFWATWCGPCMMLGPVIEELAGDYEGRAVIAKLNVDENSKIAAQYGIRSIPSLLVFKNGQVVDQMVGAMPKNTIATKLDEHIA